MIHKRIISFYFLDFGGLVWAGAVGGWCCRWLVWAGAGVGGFYFVTERTLMKTGKKIIKNVEVFGKSGRNA
jgi:hypothetical protein